MRCHCIAGVYRPPRLTATAMEDDPDRRRSAKERRREREASRRGGRSALVRLYCRHMSDDPACAPSIGPMWCDCRHLGRACGSPLLVRGACWAVSFWCAHAGV